MRLNIPAPPFPGVFFSLPYSASAANIGANAGIRRHSIAAESGLAADIMRARVTVREETDSKGRTTVRSARVERLPRQDVSSWKKSIPFQYFFFFFSFLLVCVCLVWLHKQMATDILISTGNTLGLSSAGIWHQQTTESGNKSASSLCGGALEVGAPRAKAMQMKPAVYLRRSGNTIDWRQ